MGGWLRIKLIVKTVFEIAVFISDIFGCLNFFLICVPTSLGWVGGRLLGTMSPVCPDLFFDGFPYGVFNNMCSGFNTFMEDKVDKSSGKKYFFRINLDQESKKSKMV